MGFAFDAYDIVIPTSILDMLDLLNRIKLVVMWVLWYFGLFHPSDSNSYWRDRADRFPVANLTWTTSTPETAELIKKRLPVVEFGHFGEEEESEEPTCAVCMCCLQRREEVRELCNCRHVFHKGCLDKWVDQGKTICPLCRSGLLPEKATGNQGDELLVVDRVSHLLGEYLGRN